MVCKYLIIDIVVCSEGDIVVCGEGDIVVCSEGDIVVCSEGDIILDLCYWMQICTCSY